MSLDTNNILTATDLLINQRLSELKRDTTIEATIIDNNNSSIGEYTVRYQNSALKVYTDNLSITYKVDEVVYISVQDGDLSNKLFIIGRKNTNTQQYVDIIDISQTVDLIGKPISDIYSITDKDAENGGPIGIKGYSSAKVTIEVINDANEKITIDKNPIYLYNSSTNGISANDKLFQTYKNNAKYLYITADFKTIFPENLTISYGNYGLIFEFLSVEDVVYQYVLDRDVMLGNIFAQGETLTQTLILDLEEVSLKCLKSIKFFSEGFTHKKVSDDNKLDTILDEQLVDKQYENEIFVSNIFMSFAVDINSINGYSANILTPDGYFISLGGIESSSERYVRLVPQLKYNGKEINLSNYTVEWFEFDNTIVPGHEDYRTSAGRNWKYISNETELFLKSSDYFKFQTYKCVFYYQTSITVSAEKIIYQAPDQIDIFYINYLKNSNGIVDLSIGSLDSGYEEKKAQHSFSWSYTDTNGSVFSAGTSDKISFDIKEVDKVRRYACNISFKPDINSSYSYFVASVFYAVTKENVLADFLVTFQTDNQGIFLYNENGYLEADEAYSSISDINGLTLTNKGRQLTFDIIWNKEELAYTYLWLPPGITEENIFNYVSEEYKLTSKYVPENSMLIFSKDNVLQNSHNINDKNIVPLFYSLKDNYQQENGNNTITLCIIIDGERYYFYFNFNFSKQGDLGTNGTDYQFILVPCDIDFQGSATSTRNFKYSAVNQNFLELDNLSYYVRILNNGLDVTDQYNISCNIPKPYQNNTILMDGAKLKNLKSTLSLDCKFFDTAKTVIFKTYNEWQRYFLDLIDEYQNYLINPASFDEEYVKDLEIRVNWLCLSSEEADNVNNDFKFGKPLSLKTSTGAYYQIKQKYFKASENYDFKYSYNNSLKRLRFFVSPPFNKGFGYQFKDSLSEDLFAEDNIIKAPQAIKNVEQKTNLNTELYLHYYSNIVEIVASLKDDVYQEDLSYNLYQLLPLGISIDTNYYINNPPVVTYTAEGLDPKFSQANLNIVAFPGETENVNFGTFQLSIPVSSDNKIASLIKRIDPLTGVIVPELFYNVDYCRNAVYIREEKTEEGSTSSIGIISPIICHANAYSIIGINEWDGISLDISEEAGTIYAAQIGAGTKDEYGRFTGSVLGLYDTQESGDDSKIGLWGFQDGVASFGFKSDGTAFIGRSDFGGQIQFDGNGGIIQSSNYSTFESDIKVLYGAQNSVSNPGFSSLKNYREKNSFYDGSNLFEEGKEYHLELIYSYFIKNQYKKSYYYYNKCLVDPSDSTEPLYKYKDGSFIWGIEDTKDKSYVETDVQDAKNIKILENQAISVTETCQQFTNIASNFDKTHFLSGVGVKFPLGNLPVIRTGSGVIEETYLSNQQIFDFDFTTGSFIKKEDGTYSTSKSNVLRTSVSSYQQAIEVPAYLLLLNPFTTTGKLEGYILFDIDGTLTYSHTGYIEVEDPKEPTWNFNLTSVVSEGNGMRIDLTNGKMYAANFSLNSSEILIDSGDQNLPAIQVGTNFTIYKNGTGMIAGWKISQGSISAGTNTILDSENNQIIVNKGEFGPWHLNNEGFYSENKNVYLYASGLMQLGVSPYTLILNSDGLIIGDNQDNRSLSITKTSISIGGSNWYGGGVTISGSSISIGGNLTISGGGISIGSSWGGGMVIESDKIRIGSTYSGGGMVIESDKIRIGSTYSGGGMIIESKQITIGKKMTITEDSVAIDAGTNLKFAFGTKGLSLKEGDNLKIELGWSLSDTAYPYLQLGAGGTSADTVMRLGKRVNDLWMGNQTETNGMSVLVGGGFAFFVNNTKVFYTEKNYLKGNIYAVLAD